jgi:hypothetical protein
VLGIGTLPLPMQMLRLGREAALSQSVGTLAR